MPRPKNYTLRELFYNSDNPTEIVCSLGNCNGRKLSDKTGNLERHLRTMHPVCYDAYLKQKDYPSVKKVEGDITRVPCEFNKRNIKTAVAELFTKNCIPLRVIEDRAFKMLVKPVFDVLKMSVSVQNVVDQTVSYSQIAKQDLINELKGRLLSLKIDAAARKNVSVLGINVQYITKSYIKHQTLAVKMLDEQQNSEQLVALVLEVLTDYNIGTSQIISITTDNGSFMANDLEGSLDDDKIRETTDNALELIGSNFLFPGIINVPCGSHALYCCVQDVLKSDIFVSKIEKWRAAAKNINSLPNCDIELELDNPLRWYTTYDMFESIYALKDMISSDALPRIQDLSIGNDDWTFLEQALNLFKVIFQAINKLQSQGLCYGDFYITIMDSIFQLKKLPDSDLKTTFLEILNKEKSRLLEADLFVSAVFLDPRVKITLTLGQIVRAKNFIEHLHKRLISLKEYDGSPAKEDHKKDTVSTTHAPNTLDELLQTLENKSRNVTPTTFDTTQMEMDDCNTSNSSQHTTTIDDITPVQSFEVDMLMYGRQQRLPLTENVMKYWSNQNNSLSRIADTLLAIPFSQANMNRTDAALKYILSEESKTLSSKNLQHVLFLKANELFSYL